MSAVIQSSHEHVAVTVSDSEMIFWQSLCTIYLETAIWNHTFSCQNTSQLKWMYCTRPWGLRRALSPSLFEKHRNALYFQLLRYSECDLCLWVELWASLWANSWLLCLLSETRAFTDALNPPTHKFSFTLCDWHKRSSLYLLAFGSLTHICIHTHTKIHIS